MTTSPIEGGVAARARDWHHASQAAVCDVLEPWAHGTVVRATRYPSYFDFNVVRVEDDPAMSVDALEASADKALAGLAHRRVDCELVTAAEPLRSRSAAGVRHYTVLAGIRGHAECHERHGHLPIRASSAAPTR